MDSVEIVMSEFGSNRSNAGGARLPLNERLEPSLSSIKQIFQAAKITLYTDQDSHYSPLVNVVKVDPPFDRRQSRYGWRAHDYYQAQGLLRSSERYAIAIDSDMLIVSAAFAKILILAETFGLALPINPRLLAKIDGTIGADSTYKVDGDPTEGLGMSYNLTPIAFDTTHTAARSLLENYSDRLRLSPGRGAVHLISAAFEQRFAPYALPPQWCVCSPKDLESKHIWTDAIALHVGHKDVERTWRRKAWLAKVRRAFTSN